jgi:hypothetical protein
MFLYGRDANILSLAMVIARRKLMILAFAALAAGACVGNPSTTTPDVQATIEAMPTSTPTPVSTPSPTATQPQSTPDRLPSPDTPGATTDGSAIGSSFTITSALCNDQQGPDCSTLRLGDEFLTTYLPANGYLYSCSGANPNAPGSTESKITWIDFTEKTWNFFKKLWLPAGAFDSPTGTYTETTMGNQRSISINNLPVDGMIGDWPMTNYPELTDIDRNPGVPTAADLSFTYPVTPSEAASPSCLSLGAIGVTTNGVVIYNAADARGEDAVAREIVDALGGHPARSEYHYHFIPERLDDKFLSDGHSAIVGYINDGFPLYGYRGENGIEMSNEGLDLCHGHSHGDLGYHYHATIEYPYTVGCYKGNPVPSSPSPNTG